MPGTRFLNEETNELVYSNEITLHMEHSLVAVSKWESIWHKPYFSSSSDMTIEELISYFQCMTLTQNVPPLTYKAILASAEPLDQIQKYLQNPMSATVLSPNDNHEEGRGRARGRAYTSEFIYHLMIEAGISKDYEKWHIERLINLIGLRAQANAPEKKLTPGQIAERNRKLNDERRAQLNTKG